MVRELSGYAAWTYTDILKIQLMANIPRNTAHPIVKIIAVPAFFMVQNRFRVQAEG